MKRYIFILSLALLASCGDMFEYDKSNSATIVGSVLGMESSYSEIKLGSTSTEKIKKICEALKNKKNHHMNAYTSYTFTYSVSADECATTNRSGTVTKKYAANGFTKTGGSITIDSYEQMNNVEHDGSGSHIYEFCRDVESNLYSMIYTAPNAFKQITLMDWGTTSASYKIAQSTKWDDNKFRVTNEAQFTLLLGNNDSQGIIKKRAINGFCSNDPNQKYLNSESLLEVRNSSTGQSIPL